MIQTLTGRLAGVRQTLYRTHLLTQATLGRTLNTKRLFELDIYCRYLSTKLTVILPLPRDLSPTEGEGSAAGYSALWRWAGYSWGTWTLAACHHSPRSYTRPHGACSQDHSWAYTADKVWDEEKSLKKGKTSDRMAQGHCVHKHTKENFLINSAEGSSCIRNKVKFSSCKSPGHNSSPACAITILRKKSCTLQCFWHHLIWFQLTLSCENKVSSRNQVGFKEKVLHTVVKTFKSVVLQRNSYTGGEETPTDCSY